MARLAVGERDQQQIGDIGVIPSLSINSWVVDIVVFTLVDSQWNEYV